MHPPTTSAAPSTTPQGTSVISRELGVMLVDDEAAYLDLLQQLLGEQLACPVHSFTRSREALSALPGLNIGLIVTDYHMPGLDGLEFLHEVEKIRPGLPAVMITAHEIELSSGPAARLSCLRAIVRKPFKWTVLAEEISRYWTGSRPPFPFSR
jgi:DNA-binding NtrC family response regulator